MESSEFANQIAKRPAVRLVFRTSLRSMRRRGEPYKSAAEQVLSDPRLFDELLKAVADHYRNDYAKDLSGDLKDILSKFIKWVIENLDDIVLFIIRIIPLLILVLDDKAPKEQ